MSTPLPGSPKPVPQSSRPVRRVLRWPEPNTPRGTVLYGVIAGLIVWLVVNVLSHLHIVVSWR
jgi:hypothetical protein